MKLAKTMVLLGVAAIAAMAFSATASATTLTNNNGETIGAGLVGETANVGELALDGTVNIKCKKSFLKGELTNAGGSESTVKGPISTLTAEECGPNTVTIVSGGSLEVHTDKASANGDGILTSTGLNATVLTHNILGTVHCIYETSGTTFGTLDGSKNTGGKATLTIDSAAIPRLSTDFGCGSTSEMTGEYQVNSPSYLDVD